MKDKKADIVQQWIDSDDCPLYDGEWRKCNLPHNSQLIMIAYRDKETNKIIEWKPKHPCPCERIN